MKKKLRDVTLLIINQSAPGMGQHKKNLRNDEKNTKASLRFFFTTVIKPYFFNKDKTYYYYLPPYTNVFFI